MTTRALHRRRAACERTRRADAVLAAGDARSALALYDAVLRGDARPFDAAMGRAAALEALGDLGAQEAYARAAGLAPDDPNPLVGRARVMAGELDAGVEDDWLSALDPFDGPWDLPDPFEAARLLDRALELDPGHLKALRLRAHVRDRLFMDGGAEDLDAALRIAPHDPGTALVHAAALDAQGRLSEAAAVLDPLRAEDLPTSAERLRLAALRETLPDAERALSDLDAAVALDPGEPEARRARARLLRRLGRPLDALADREVLAHRRPDDLANHRAMALILTDLDEPIRAEAAFDRVIVLYDRGARDVYHRGNLRMRREWWAGALTDFVRAVELDPRCAFAWNNRGLMHGRLGDEAAKMNCLRHALDHPAASLRSQHQPRPGPDGERPRGGPGPCGHRARGPASERLPAVSPRPAAPRRRARGGGSDGLRGGARCRSAQRHGAQRARHRAGAARPPRPADRVLPRGAGDRARRHGRDLQPRGLPAADGSARRGAPALRPSRRSAPGA